MFALITGISGQDGSYLSEFLLEKGYSVVGIIRRSSTMNGLQRLTKETRSHANFKLTYGDVTDASCVSRIVREWYYSNFDPLREKNQFEIYNLAAQSHVQVSFEMPEYTNQTNVMGVYNVLNAILALPVTDQRNVRFYQASSSEMFGLVQEIPQTETTKFYPRSPYAVSKVGGYWATVNARESYDLFACNGILFNHESPRRGENFVTRKITRQVAEICHKKRACVVLGNVNSKRDWGHARDYVRAMWLMLQQDTPRDFVVATGKQYSVKQFVEETFRVALNIEINWRGSNEEEVGFDAKNPENILVRVDPKFFRPAEVETLLGNPQLAHDLLAWKPSVSFEDLVKEMITEDLKDDKSGNK